MFLKHINIGGMDYPVHFGMAALMEISQELGSEADNFLASLQTTNLKDRLQIAYTGLCHGCRIGQKNAPENLGAFCDLLDENPEALEDIIATYYLQTFGKTVEKLLAEAEKLENEEVNAATEQLKNVWPVLTEKASKLASVEYRR